LCGSGQSNILLEHPTRYTGFLQACVLISASARACTPMATRNRFLSLLLSVVCPCSQEKGTQNDGQSEPARLLNSRGEEPSGSNEDSLVGRDLWSVYRINEPIPARCGAVGANPSRIVNENHEEISKSMERPKAKPPMIEMVQRLLMELQELGWGQDETMTEVLDRCTPPSRR
jgi:hypothetical protein